MWRWTIQIILVAGVFLAICLFRIHRLGPDLDRAGDAYSEANSIRAADAYLSEGFTAHYGLQRIIYGERFPDVGAIKDERFFGGTIPADPNAYVYTHYPPGPDYLIAITGWFAGLDNLTALRLVPVLFTTASFVVLMLVVSRAFSLRIVGPLTGVVLILAPIVARYAVVMHLQAYTTAMLLLALALCIHAFWIAKRLSGWHLAGLGLLGFCQGWMSFDYCFVTTFFAVPVWLLARADARAASLRTLMLMVLVSGAAFTFAHLLHLLQVMGELGGLQPAIAELTGAAKYRAGVEAVANAELPHQPFALYVWDAISAHLYLLFDGFKDSLRRETFSFAMVGMLLAAAVVHLQSTGRGRAYHLLAMLAALAIALAWSCVMPQHARVHVAFTLRHALLLYLVAWFSLIIWLSPSTTPSASPARRPPA